MKTILTSTVAALIILTGCNSDNSKKNEPIKKQQEPIKKEITIKDVGNLPLSKKHNFVPMEIKKSGSLLLAKGYFNTPSGKRQVNMFLSPNLETAVYGRAFDTNTSKEIKSYSIEELKKNAGLVYGNGTTEYFLVVDPLCPYCMRFDKELTKYNNEIKLYVIFMPLTRIHPDAPKAVAYILSQKDNASKFEALSRISNGHKDYLSLKTISPEIQAMMDKQTQLSSELGARGTPSLFLKDGTATRISTLNYVHSKLEEANKKKSEKFKKEK